jgi:hypothetical protein
MAWFQGPPEATRDPSEATRHQGIESISVFDTRCRDSWSHRQSIILLGASKRHVREEEEEKDEEEEEEEEEEE